MKRLAILLIAIAPVFFTGCFEILEEIYLKSDGSGTYLYTIDMSALMDESMKELLQAEGDNSLVGVEVDSIMYFKDSHPDEIKSLKKPEIFERAFMKLQMSDSEDMMVMQFGLDFENVNEIAYFMQNLNQFTGETMQGGEMGSGLLLTPQTAEMFSLKGKKLSRTGFSGLGAGTEGEEMDMMSLFMDSATFSTLYHMPSKVKKTTIVGAVIEGKTVRVDTPLIDLMKGETTPTGWIKY